MRTIERTGRFRRDFRRVAKGRYGRNLSTVLEEALEELVQDRPLARRYEDHALTGDWVDYRDCHLRPDLVLIYRLLGFDTLLRARIGSHSELDL